MDAIYHFAQITIVAAAGSDANAGLPGFGVHARPAATQNGTREPELDREWYKPNFWDVIPASTWSNRGWTLQEQLLSKRCLFITRYQIYFQCRCSTIEEEYGLCFERGNDTSSTDPSSYTNILYNRHLDNKQRMQGAVTAYTSRQLTNPADVLDAFAGITNGLNFLASGGARDAVPPSDQSNAPVHFTKESNIPEALCWDWKGLPVKRPGVNYPSWHWSAWLGPIEFPFEAYWGKMDDPYVNHPGQGLKRYSHHEGEGSVDEIHSPQLRILAENVPWTLLIRGKYVVQSSFNLKKTEGDRSGSLKCWVATYSGSEQSTRMNIYSDGSEASWVGVIDTKNIWISVIESPTVQLGWISLFKRSNFGDRQSHEYLKSDDVMIVMLVRRDSNGYCSRLGIGEIDGSAWKSAKPEKTSILFV